MGKSEVSDRLGPVWSSVDERLRAEIKAHIQWLAQAAQERIHG